MGIAGQLAEAMSDGDEFPVDEAFLKEVAQVFNKKYAKTRFIKGTPEVKDNSKVILLRVDLQPYNDAKVDSLSLWIEKGGQARMTVSGSAPGDDAESQGFTHAMAEVKFKYDGETAEQLAKKAFDLSKKMK